MKPKTIILSSILILFLFVGEAVFAQDILLVNEGQKRGGVTYTEKALKSRGDSYDRVSGKQMGQANFKISKYKVLMTPEWWNDQTTKALNENSQEIKDFVKNGGVFIVLQSLNGNTDIEHWTNRWSPYRIYVELFYKGDPRSGKGYEQAVINKNQTGHPIFKGFKNRFLQTGESCGMKGLSEEWTILASSEKANAPQIVVAKYGAGMFIVSVVGNAFKYNKEFNNTLLFDNIVDYALSQKK